MTRAIPTGRATHASHRARILGLGLLVGIAIALGGCHPSFRQPEVAKEADLSCYWYVPDYASEPDIQAAMADGSLSEKECTDVVMPRVRQSLDLARTKRRVEAVEAVRDAIAMEARQGGNAEERSHAKHDSAGAKHIAQPLVKGETNHG